MFDSIEVADVRVEGNSSFADGTLLDLLRTQSSPWWLTASIYSNFGARFPFAQEPQYFDGQLFEDDIALLRQHYKNTGFFSATVEGSWSRNEDGEIDVLFTIEEGEPSQIDSVGYRNLSALPDSVLEIVNRSPLLRPGRRYRADEVYAERGRVLEILANNGFPRATLDSITVERKLSNNNVVIKLSFRHGRRLYFGEITESITGVDELNLARKIVYDRLDFDEGEVFSLRRVNDAETNLNRLGVFSYVSLTSTFPPIENMSDSLVPMKLELQPRKRFEIAPGLIVSNQLNGLTTGGEVSFLMRNVFAGAQTLTTHFNLLGRIPNVTSTYLATSQLRFDQPYLFSNRNSGHIVGSYSLVGEENLASGNILSLVVGTDRYLSKRATARLSWAYEISEFSGNAAALFGRVFINLDQNETVNFRNSIRTFSIENDGTNDLFNPSEGAFVKAMIEEAGLLEQLGISPLPQENDARGIRSTQYIKYEGLIRMFWDLSRNNTTIAGTKFRLGVISRFGRSLEEDLPVPPNRRYYAGGAQSIRGWTARELAANPEAAYFGSNALVEFSSELRWQLFPNERSWLDGFWFVTFVDAGNLWEGFENINLAQTAIAFGVGIRYNLFFGPIRVDFGMKGFNPSADHNRWFWEKQLWSEVIRKGAFQFGIGHAF
ncbi:MAG: BamA/TamA family outer membrane protein [Bacteroidetes bacterium]|nr:BamA/TamA family outer membrane protein [Bacteroidota bacterium]